MRAIPLIALLCAISPATASGATGDLRSWGGGPTPGIELEDVDGRRHRLEDYRGQVVLVNFWATWCVPCREEMPSIARLKQSLAGRPFAVLAVNVDEPESRVRAFLAQVPLGFPVLMDPGGRATKAWTVRILPASFLVALDGRVRYTVTGELDWANEHVIGLVSELLPAVQPRAGGAPGHATAAGPVR